MTKPMRTLDYNGVTIEYNPSWKTSKAFRRDPELAVRVIDELRDGLNGIAPLRSVYKEMAMSSMVTIAEQLWPGKFDAYVERVLKEQFTANRRQVSVQAFMLEYILPESSNGIPIGKVHQKFILPHVLREGELQKKLFPKENRKVYETTDDVWSIYLLNVDTLSSRTFDFRVIKNASFRQCLKTYLANGYKGGQWQPLTSTPFENIKTCLLYIQDAAPEVLSLRDINITLMRKLLHYLEHEIETNRNRNTERKGMAPKTVFSHIRLMDSFLDFFVKKPELLPTGEQPPHQNPFSRVVFRAIDDHVKNADFIPEEVIDQIYLHRADLNNDVRHIFEIMSGTGMRVGEANSLEEDWLRHEPLKDEYWLKYLPNKTAKFRKLKGLDKFHVINVADNDVLAAFIQQAESTKDMRSGKEIKEIFVRRNSKFLGDISPLSTGTIIREMNELIAKHNICTWDGTLWRFGTHQCRKTLAVDLINDGATTPELLAQFNWATIQTADTYYNEAKQLKLADMNNEFWNKRFEVHVGEEVLKAYTEDERRQLFVDFCLGRRDVEFGQCVKHMADGPCGKRSEHETSCAECPNLCTGKKYRKKWQNLVDSQIRITDELVRAYQSEGIPEAVFSKYREYQSEKHRLDSYTDTLRNIDL